MNRERLSLLVLFLIPASIASAHPGHGPDGGSHEWIHYLSDPLHLAGLAVLVAACLFAALALATRRATATKS